MFDKEYLENLQAELNAEALLILALEELTEQTNNDMAYLNRKIESKSILEKLSKVRGAEVWNSTYAEAIETLANNGLFVTIDPFETRSTADGIAWVGRYAEILEGTVYYYDMASSYIEWNEAAADTIEDALDRLIDDIEDELIPQPEPEKPKKSSPATDTYDKDPYPIE